MPSGGCVPSRVSAVKVTLSCGSSEACAAAPAGVLAKVTVTVADAAGNKGTVKVTVKLKK